MDFTSIISNNRENLHILVDTGITYKVSIKQSQYTSVESEVCNRFTYSAVSNKKTITFTCKQPLQGKYIEIVASGSQETTLKVFEIELYGRFLTSHIFYHTCIRIIIICI